MVAGSRHTCGVRNDGSIWCWGANDDGELGQGEAGGDVLALTEAPCPAP